ncbi:MAG TPA: hypothetical protein EYP78_02630 [Candidatus Omnitrophica bacterium]|nr:hypothetical protein [Candidatus Omnitrophota bacterium]
MANVNEVLVREFLERRGFLVKGDRKFPSRGKVDRRGIDFFIINLRPSGSVESPPFLLDPESISLIRRAVVRIEGWHTDRFYPSVILRDEKLFNFINPGSLEEAKRIFTTSDFKKILVISKLPVNQQMRDESLRILKDKGIDHVLTFIVILSEVIKNIRSNKNYYNDSLELLRILKQYKLLKKPQLELFSE